MKVIVVIKVDISKFPYPQAEYCFIGSGKFFKQLTKDRVEMEETWVLANTDISKLVLGQEVCFVNLSMIGGKPDPEIEVKYNFRGEDKESFIDLKVPTNMGNPVVGKVIGLANK